MKKTFCSAACGAMKWVSAALLLTPMTLLLAQHSSFPPPVLKPVDEGATVIEGAGIGCPGGRAAAIARIGQQLLAVNASMADGLRGTIRIELASPLERDATVEVEYSLACPDQPLLTERTQVVVGAADGKWVEIAGPIYETQTKITGTAGAGVKKVRVFLIASGGYADVAKAITAEPGSPFQDPAYRALSADVATPREEPPSGPLHDTWVEQVQCRVGRILQQEDVAVGEDRKWEMTPAHGLDHGQCIVAQKFAPNGRPQDPVDPAFPHLLDYQVVQSVSADWGRLRGTFSAGATTGQENGTFKQASPYLSFYVESNLLNWNMLKKSTRSGKITLSGLGSAFHIFTEGRLSQAAVTLPGLADPIKAATDQKQALWFQLGAYVPVRVSGFDWWHDGHLYSFSLGPMVKYGATWV